MSRRSLLLILASMLLGGLAANAKVNYGSAQLHPAVPPTLLELPATWQPFSAEMTTDRSGWRETGHFYRRSDGSTAIILVTPIGTAITIHNVADRRTYNKLGDGPWKSYDINAAALRAPEP